MLAALSTGHKLGLFIVAAVFIAFALASSFLFPRFRPTFPGRGGLGVFIVVSVVLFLAMLGAVEVFAKEEEEEPERAAETGGGTPEPPGETTTQTGTNATPARTIKVTETEFKIQLGDSSLAPGTYTFDVVNKGKVPHNLVISGPEVDNESSATIAGGKTTEVEVSLDSGDYDFYCSVPGHKEAGMELKVHVA